MKYLSAISITLAAFMFACTSLPNGQDILSITMVAGAPSTYNGKVISLSGWMTMRAEDHNLWETRSDHEKWNTKKCVSLKNYFNTAQLRKAVDGKMVVVTEYFTWMQIMIQMEGFYCD